jgi:glycosyltransferase involved in cell wall biosynthesis
VRQVQEASGWERRRRPSLLYVTTVASTADFLAPFASHFRARGWRVELATNAGSAETALRKTFDDVHHVPTSRSIRDVADLIRARRSLPEIVKAGFDIVHVHTPIAAFITRAVIARMPSTQRPAVAYTAHGFHFHHAGHIVTNAAFATAERVAGRWTERLIVISDEDYDAARRLRIVPRNRLVQMPGIGLDTSYYATEHLPAGSNERIRMQLGIPAEAPVFVFVGELNANKRASDLLVATAKSRRGEAHSVFVGDGPEHNAIARLAELLHTEDRIHFTGSVVDVRPYVAAATALVLPSAREGLARSIMEALALEVPVIASTARGNAQLVGPDGLIYPTGDVELLSEHMDWMIDHPVERSEMGRRGRRRMVARYDITRLIDLHETLYEEMLLG